MPERRVPGVRDELSESIAARVQEQLVRSFTGRGRLPDGVVTILFTDVVGSSQLVSTLGDQEARLVLRRHDEEIRRAFEVHEGTEVERAGDSFMAAFRLPRQALACGLEIQRSFAGPSSQPVRLRIGMDTGEIITEDQGYFGHTVFRASRIAGLADGGQILLSEATKVLGEQAGFTFKDLGEKELKGLGGGHRVFEAIGGPQA